MKYLNKRRFILFAAILFSFSSNAQQQTDTPDKLDRTILPIKVPINPPITELDARNAKRPARFQVTAPKGAPNVLIILIDDQGFGVSSAFGGPVKQPTLDKMATEGLRYNNFNTCALCSPTRNAIQTGYNHHSVNSGAVAELATAFPGNTGVRPQTITTMAEVLRMNGYSTAAFGKYHETAPWEVSASGPFDHWPTHSGYDKFYGFIGGETNQWVPAIYDGETRVETPNTPNYHFTADMTDKAIKWIQEQQTLTPDKPFFTYFATGGTHAPHHAPKEWIAKYKGQFDMGWDKLREITLARQIEMAIVPAGTKLAPKPAGLPDWDTLTAKQKQLFARQMETFAGFAAYTDYEVGRLVDALKGMGELDNTLVFYIVGDNGSSAEGGMSGSFNEIVGLNGMQENFDDVYKKLDEWGSPSTFPHFAIPWAVATNAPFAWTKQVASDFGGTRNGVVVRWPNVIKAKNEIRNQFCHAIDIAPTIYEACNIPAPKVVNGIEQRPIEGVSMLYSFDDKNAAAKHTTQYFEMFGNRAIYNDGWVARTIHKSPWKGNLNTLDKDVWQLYNVKEDFSEANDLSATNPAKLKELQDLFLKEAVKYNVLPLDDRTFERFDAGIAGRPDIMGTRTKLNLYEGMSLAENACISVKSKSYNITADVSLPNANANGVIIAQAGRFGGWTLYMKNGKLHHEYNWFGSEKTNIASAKVLTPGKHNLKYEFVMDAAKPGSGGKCLLYVDGEKVAEGQIPKTMPFFYSADEGVDVGADHETVVSNDYKEGDNKFTGKIKVVTIETFPVKK